MTKVLTERTLRVHLNDDMSNGYYITRGKLKTADPAVYIHQYSDDSYTISVLGYTHFEKNMNINQLYAEMIERYVKGSINLHIAVEMSNGYYIRWGHFSKNPVYIEMQPDDTYCLTMFKPYYEHVNENYDYRIKKYA